MSNQKENGNNRMSNQEQNLRPWITPTFERVELKEAMSGFSGSSYDGVTSYSQIYS